MVPAPLHAGEPSAASTTVVAPTDVTPTATRILTPTGHDRQHGGSAALRMLSWGVAAVVALGALAMGTGVFSTSPGGPQGPAERVGGSDRDQSWSYYHDRDYATRDTGAKWDTDRSRSTDPEDAALGTTSRWEYQGPYRYGTYGSDGMRRRAAGRETVDPLYSDTSDLPDVFATYGSTDPSGGQPVGMMPSPSTSPYYDPYAGYSNPYSNRIRLAYGEGVGRGAMANF